MRRVVLLGGLALAVLGSVLFVATRPDVSDAEASDRLNCAGVKVEWSDADISVEIKRMLFRPEPVEGWVVVQVAPRAAGWWAFVDDGSGAPRGVRSEGRFLIDYDTDVPRLDMVSFDHRVPEGDARRRERIVAIGGERWIEDARYTDRVHCPGYPTGSELENYLVHIAGAAPFLDRLAKGGRDNLAPNVGPGVRLLAREESSVVEDGVVLTTYEEHPVERYEQIRTRFTLDGAGQLRWAEARDTTTDTVLYERRIWPASDHPPIEDPTGDPIVTVNP